MDSPWDEGYDTTAAFEDLREAEWTKMSEEFTNTGYREGITAGKEASVQEGFDAGFADVGAPLGRDLGLTRGKSSALLSFLIFADSTTLGVSDEEKEALVVEARDVASQLGNIRYSDIEPRDLEAEKHAREHLEAEGQAMELNDDLEKKKQMEGVEDMLARMSAGENHEGPGRPTMEDVLRLRVALEWVPGAESALGKLPSKRIRSIRKSSTLVQGVHTRGGANSCTSRIAEAEEMLLKIGRPESIFASRNSETGFKQQ